MKITDLRVYLTKAGTGRTWVFVELDTDEGITGLGEATNSGGGGALVVGRALEMLKHDLEGQDFSDGLVGQDPEHIDRIWHQIYRRFGTLGSRGFATTLCSGIDMALWDIRGKAAGKPCWQLLGEPRTDRVVPYASLQPMGESYEEYRDSLVAWAVRAKELGFTAGKMEVTLSGPYNHSGLDEPDERVTEVVAACRNAVGSDFVMMVDVQYAWDDVDAALQTLNDWKELDIYFIETPLQIDDLKGYARLHREAPMPIAAGEWQTTRHEFADLMDVGLVDVAQPDVGRVGGLTEAMRVCRMAAERDRLIVPHCWKTGIGISASLHMATVTPHCPFIEFMPSELCDSLLRKELVQDEMRIEDGKLAIPTKPGLGIELNQSAVKKFRVD